MKIVIDDGRPVVRGNSAGNEILFFAKINEHLGYCVVFGPPEKCLPKEDVGMAELFAAKVAFGALNAEMEIVHVKHGHKYAQGGGFVETAKGQVFFRLPKDPMRSTYEGMKIEEVYAVI
jgi:hypothetical protein